MPHSTQALREPLAGGQLTRGPSLSSGLVSALNPSELHLEGGAAATVAPHPLLFQMPEWEAQTQVTEIWGLDSLPDHTQVPCLAGPPMGLCHPSL